MTTITPGNLNLTIYTSDTFSASFTWNDSGGNPMNLTGYTARMQGRYNLTDTSPFITFQTGGTPSITLGGVAGTIALLASSSVTSLLAAGVGLYDLQLTDGSGNTFTLLQGSLTVQEMVTR